VLQCARMGGICSQSASWVPVGYGWPSPPPSVAGRHRAERRLHRGWAPPSKSVHKRLAQRGAPVIHRTWPNIRVSRRPRHAEDHLHRDSPGGASPDAGRVAAAGDVLAAALPGFQHDLGLQHVSGGMRHLDKDGREVLATLSRSGACKMFLIKRLHRSSNCSTIASWSMGPILRKKNQTYWFSTGYSVDHLPTI
jgi:hypothetical protein